MVAHKVNRALRRSHVLGARLTRLELKHFHETIRNYGIKRDSDSACLRALLVLNLHGSRRFRKKALKHLET